MKNEKVNIFYIDDDADDRMLFEEALAEVDKSITLTALEDADELLHILDNPPPVPHLIFVDLNMPRKNGYQLLKEIKSNQSFRRFPVLILTTSAEEEAIENARLLGANAFITKPSNFASLKAILNKCLTLDWNIASPHGFVIGAN